MSVLLFTIFVSTMLALFFVGAFLYHHDYSGGDSMRDSLLPFGKEKIVPSRESELPSDAASPPASSDGGREGKTS